MEYYTWILTFHIMAFMSWMSMLFYLPRLYVYHVENLDKKDFTDIIKVQEFKLYKYIGLPAMWASIISGAAMLVLNPYIFEAGLWMYAKLFVLLLLIAYSYSLEHYRLSLEKDECKKTTNFFRAYNEVPTFLSILIVAYVITKTFSLIFTAITLLLTIFVIYKVYTQKHKG